MKLFFVKIFKYIEFYFFKKTFSHKFNFYTTEDPKDLDELFALRYQVYCEEYGYLKKNDYPDKKESDKYDEHSVHFVLRHVNGEIAATVRLIVDSEAGLPIEENFQLDVSVPEDLEIKFAEISRLIVTKKFRKHFLLLALVKGLFVYTKSNNINQIYCVMDDRLIGVLTRMGFPFKKVGKPAIYQGLTSPYLLNVTDMLNNLKVENHILYNYLANGMLKYDDKTRNYTIN